MTNIECSLKTLSPVHISSGKEYDNSEFILSQAKTKNNKRINIIKRIDLLKYYNSLNEDKKDEFLVNLTESKDLSQFDNRISKEYTRYQCINNVSKAGVNHFDKIIENVKTLNQLYIPGSSIKGAIKTALFYKLFESEDLNKIHNIINYRRGNNRDYQELIDSYFSNPKRNSAQYSIMKFLEISDTNSTKLPSIYDVITIKATSNNGFVYHEKNDNTVRNYLETIEKNRKLKFNMNININDKIINYLRLNDKKDIISLNNIKESLYEFNKDLIEYELEFASIYHIDFLEKFYQKLEKENTLKQPLLHLGSGSGFMSTTIGLKIKKENLILFDEVSKTAPKHYDYEFPKSRKIIPNGGNPLGWVKLTF